MKAIGVFGAPVDFGASRRGTDMGPSAIRYAKLQQTLTGLGCEVVNHGNLHIPVPETRQAGNPQMKFASEIVEACEQLAGRVEQIIGAGQIPLVLGGDHSLTMGSLAGAAKGNPNLGLIWMDAHGDFNTPETSPSGNIHGMSLAASVGLGPEILTHLGGFSPKVKPEFAVLVGVRKLDKLEKHALRDYGIRVYTMKDIDELGIAAVMRQAIEIAGAGGRNCIFVSLDLDVMDPAFAPGVGTPETGGLASREAHLALEVLAESQLLCGMEIMEVNPILDEHNKTARLGVELVASALGQRII